MPIELGLVDIDDIKYEETQVKQVRLGEILKWEENRIIDLGIGNTFDVAAIYSKYSRLTEENFFFTTMNSVSGSDRVTWAGYDTYLRIYGGFVKSYNPETGILNMFNACGNTGNIYQCNRANVHAYLITKPQKLPFVGYGQTFDVKELYPDNYTEFTADNFVISAADNINYRYSIYNGSRTYEGTWTASGTMEYVKSYNAATGILTSYYRGYGSGGGLDPWDFRLNTRVYLAKRGTR